MILRFKMSMKYIFLAVILFILGSCSQARYIYNPPARNLHYFTAKGEAVLSAVYSTGPSRNDDNQKKNYNHGGDLQAAYAITDHWAVLASYHGRREQDRITNKPNSFGSYSEVNYRRTGWEIGTSFFLPLDSRKVSFFYVDGGFGFTKNSLIDRSFIDSINQVRNFNHRSARFFIQPGIYTGSNVIRFNIGLRFQYSAFSGQETSYTALELDRYSLSGLNNITTFEPYLGIRIGTPELPWVKADMQFGTASINKGFYVRSSFASFGLSIYPFARKSN